MPQYVEKANVITTRVIVPREVTEYFLSWQSQLNDVVAQFPGFLSLEILSPEALKGASWTLIQRFVDSKSATAWFESPERKSLFQTLIQKSPELQIEESATGEKGYGGVTEVIITQVAPEKREAYKKWMATIHLAEAKFAGFRGMLVQAPGEKQGHWITLLQFDSVENLDKWLSSDERKKILQELDPMVTSLETHRVISPFAGWFSSIAKVAEIPAVWKQTMLVLLVLFPIVMLEFKFLNPLLTSLNISPAIFIGNAISVTLISWPMMPIAIWCFRFWLTPNIRSRYRTNIIGTLILLLIYLIEILIFWSFVET